MSTFLTVLLVLAAIIAAAVGLVMFYLWWLKRNKPEEIITVTSEWQPTGKIDFHCAELPQDHKLPTHFVLRVEDYRTVESISGVEHVEIRWRNATLAEAKAVVVAHQKAADPEAKLYQFPKQVQRLIENKKVEDVHQDQTGPAASDKPTPDGRIGRTRETQPQ
jgi:hypothetical protein